MPGLGILINGTQRTQDLAYAAYNAALQEGLASVRDEQLWYKRLAMVVPSKTETEVYDWLEQASDFRPWKGERKFMPLRESAYALTNGPFDWGIEIDRDKFNDSRFLSQAQVFRMGGQNAALHPQRQIAALLRGFADSDKKCFNGNAFFYNAHPIDPYDSSKGTFSNRITNTLTPANFALARAAMMKFKDASGELLSAPPDAMLVPPDLVTTADMIANSIAVPTVSGSINSGVASVPRQRIEVIECPELSAEPGVWYLARIGGPIKPLIFQRRSEPAVEWIEDLNSSFCKKHRKVQLGADYRAAFGWTFPQLMMRCGDGSASTTLS